ncbi:hypothetical protein TWF718_007436 [Orbilia javanica]|uniref:Uncharacterized protein n=1 Tax=Orbilia javanica TaxID=47235 RepID=A0AAN8RNK5_9PEZI
MTTQLFSTQPTPAWILHVPETHSVRMAAAYDSARFEITGRVPGIFNNVMGLIPFEWGREILREWQPIRLASGGNLRPGQIIRNTNPGPDANAFYDSFISPAWNVEISGPLHAMCLEEPVAPPGCTVTKGFILQDMKDTLSFPPLTGKPKAPDIPDFPFPSEDSYMFCVTIDTCHQSNTLTIFRTSSRKTTRGVLLCYQYHPGVLAYYRYGEGEGEGGEWGGKVEQFRADDVPTAIIHVTALLGVSFEPLGTISLPNALADFNPIKPQPYKNWRKIAGSYVSPRDGVRVGHWAGARWGEVLTRDQKPITPSEVLWPRNQASVGNMNGFSHYDFIIAPPGDYNLPNTPAQRSDIASCLPTLGL